MEKKFPSYVIGLGNPGEKYLHSRHNLGRQLVELLREKKKLKWENDEGTERTESHPSLVRLKCYMNLSGIEISRLLKKSGVGPKEILVCNDDFDLPLGAIRIRKRGSPGSHNGLKSIVEVLGTDEFPRIRLGVGPLPSGINPADFVLEPISKEEQKTVQEMMEKAMNAVESIVTEGMETAMNRFNR